MRPALTCALAVTLLAACVEDSPPRVAPAQSTEGLHSTEPLEANAAFRMWLHRYLTSAADGREQLDREGAALAAARRVAMNRVILSNPELALELAVSPAERDAVPSSVRVQLEQWRDGVGTIHVIALDPEEPTDGHDTDEFVSFVGDDVMYATRLVGRRALEQTRRDVRLHGVELDGAIALTDRRLRQLHPGEVVPELKVAAVDGCSDGALFHGGDLLYSFCEAASADAFDERLHAAEEPPASAWTEGPKTLLFVRVDFSDRAGEPLSASSAQSIIESTCDQFFEANSYGKTSLPSATVTPTLRLPRTRAQYAADANSYTLLRADALALALDAGFRNTDFDHDIVAFASTYSGWAGRGYVGGRGTWLNGSFNLRVTGHELGHNWGSQHANFWSTSALNPIAPNGTTVEYGNPFDLMGGGSTQANHFTAWVKQRFNWLSPMATPTITTNGTYRIQALEPTVTSGLQGARVERGGGRAYWLEYRPAINTPSTRDGLSINWDGPGGKSQLLDMTPGDGNRNVSALVIGRTFSDSAADLHFTPIAKAGTTPEAIDVVINRGPFVGNRAPTVSLSASATSVAVNGAVTFTATASDPDGDTLAWEWDFDDGTWGPNTSMASKTFGAARAHNVRLTVSDMKGQTATATVLITVGTPTTFTLSGRVTVGGQPLDAVRVTDGTRATFSLADGTWRLANVPSGSVTISAAKVDYTFTRSFAAPLTVSANQTGLDFAATLGAGATISGTVQASGMPVANATVTDGTRTATTNASGAYTLTGVRAGGYTLTATKAGFQFSPTFTNPVEVFGVNLTGQNFNASGYSLSGSVPAALVATAPVVTDGVRTVTATRSGANWTFFLNAVPNGAWNLEATSPGVTLTPSSFTNPVVVNNQARAGLVFAAAARTSYVIRGTVRTGTTPLPGVVVSDGTRSGTTDALGNYVIVDVAPGTYTLTPTLAGNTFTPATRSATVAAADLTGQNFETTVVNQPPTVAVQAVATPAPVTGTTTAVTVLGADDTGEAQLTYTWSTAGIYPVTFSPNGSNAAKSAAVTFSGAGTYALQCTIRDPGGLTVVASVQVQVQQAATGLTVTPAAANVLIGATQFFQAQAVDQFGRTFFTSPVAWSVTGGGTISGTSSGAFIAGPTPGGPYTVQAVAAGAMGTALVTVVGAGAPSITAAATATPNPVTGTTTRVSVRATDDAGEANLVYRWQSTLGPAPVTFSANDTNAAKDADVTFTRAGTYTLAVTVADGAGNSASSVVTVEVESTPTRLTLSPTAVTLLRGQEQAFTATVFDQFDDEVVPAPMLTWTATGGSVDGDGLFTAGMSEGSAFVVTVQTNGRSATAAVTVVATPDTDAPLVTVTSPMNDAVISGLTAVSAEASDNVAVAGVTFFVDGVQVGDDTATPWEASFDASTLSVGTHLVTARATDGAGNASTSMAVRVVVGGAPPVDLEAPQVQVVTPTEGAETGPSVSFSATASDDVGVTQVDFELDGVTVTSISNSPWDFTAAVAVGAHTVVAIAHDASGKSTRSSPVAFTALEAPPITTPEQVVGSCGCMSLEGPAALLLLGALLRRRRS